MGDKIHSDWPALQPNSKFAYCFSVWPDEQCRRWNRAARQLFTVLCNRVQMEMTASEFDQFREDLATQGLTLREIERQPYFEPCNVL